MINKIPFQVSSKESVEIITRIIRVKICVPAYNLYIYIHYTSINVLDSE